MSNLYTKGFDSLNMDKFFHSAEIPVTVKSVTLSAGQGVLKRGTVLGIITATGLAVKVDKSKADGSEKANCILTDDVDTGSAGNVVATAYSSGMFNRKALIFGGDDTAADHELRLRELGIFLKDNIPY